MGSLGCAVDGVNMGFGEWGCFVHDNSEMTFQANGLDRGIE